MRLLPLVVCALALAGLTALGVAALPGPYTRTCAGISDRECVHYHVTSSYTERYDCHVFVGTNMVHADAAYATWSTGTWGCYHKP